MIARNLNLFIHRLYEGYLRIKLCRPGGIKTASINGIEIKTYTIKRGHEGEPLQQAVVYIDGKKLAIYLMVIGAAQWYWSLVIMI